MRARIELLLKQQKLSKNDVKEILQPCIIFMDEIDAIDRRISSNRDGETREFDRVLIELLSQLDGFDELDKVKVIMATNRPDVLDPALLRPGRIDKKIDFSLPNGDARMRILKIHASGITKQGDIDYEKVVRLSEGFNGADMRNICTEAGMIGLRAGHDYVAPNDFIKAVAKLSEAKKLECSAHNNAGFRESRDQKRKAEGTQLTYGSIELDGLEPLLCFSLHRFI